jgi:hypothetical protein
MLSVNDVDDLPDMLELFSRLILILLPLGMTQVSQNLILTSQRMIHHWRWIMVSLNLIHWNSQMMICSSA